MKSKTKRYKINQFKQFRFFFTGIVILALAFCATAQNPNVIISVHLHGVTESKISLLPLSGVKQYKSIADVQASKNGVPVNLVVSKEYLPGEFILSFENKEHIESQPVHSEKRILINDQDIELRINPLFAGNPDSTKFQKDERENTAFTLFSKETERQVKQLGILQNFLMNYDEPKSKFYRQGVSEYEKRRQAYNEWLTLQTIKDSSLFASSMYKFNYVPQIPWEGSEKDREQSVIEHYFDGIDFNDPFIIKTSQINDWMNNYVNLHMKLITNMSIRDSIISKAAKSAIEKSKLGSPIVYGWMVDYFYKGFEANNIPAGMKVLEPYLNDPNCLTTKRMEIDRRLKGMESMVPGIIAPEIMMTEASGNLFVLSNFTPGTKYILLLFWSADCSPCLETVGNLYLWQRMPENQHKISIIAISLDETDTEVATWNQKIPELSDWKHLRAVEGIRSKVASDYFVLATPVMVLLDAKTKEIVSLPATLNELQSSLR